MDTVELTQISDRKSRRTLNIITKADKKDSNIVEVTTLQGNVFNETTKKKFGYRHQQAVLLFLSYMVAFILRTCMGVALVAMVDHNDELSDVTNSTSVQSNDRVVKGNVGMLNGILYNEPYPTFRWDKKTQDYLLAAFSWGYVILQIPAGQLVHRFGTKNLLTGALVINGVISFCTPWAAYYGSWISILILRMIQGLTQSCFVSGIHTTFGKWVPLEERSRVMSFTYGGQPLGIVFGQVVTGFIAASSFGWPGIFRFYGLVSAITGVILCIFGADSPAQHPKISVSERRYIEEALKQTEEKGKKYHKVPWKKILCCKALYAIIMANVGQAYVHVTLYTEVPAFMDKVMKVNIKENGMLSAFPFFSMWISYFLAGCFIDMLIAKKWQSVTNIRKLAQLISFIPTVCGLISLAYVKKDIVIVETILTITCAFESASVVGFFVNPLDLAPNFAGTIISISNFVANFCGSLAPVTAGFILTEDVTNPYLWRKVFLIAAGFYTTASVAYITLGSAELQDWNTPEEETRKVELNTEENPMLQNENNIYIVAARARQC